MRWHAWVVVGLCPAAKEFKEKVSPFIVEPTQPPLEAVRYTVKWPTAFSVTESYTPMVNSSVYCVGSDLSFNAIPSPFKELEEKYGVLAQALEDIKAEAASYAGCADFPLVDHGLTEILKSIDIVISSRSGSAASSPLGPEIDESYELKVVRDSVTITAKTIWGARHALTEFHNRLEVHTLAAGQVSRLEYGRSLNRPINPTENTFLTFPYGSVFEVTDQPRLPHRGLMIDTARNYIEWPIMYRIVRAMSRSKLNVLHWHAADDEAFSIELPTAKTDGHLPANSAQVYKAEDVKTFIAYAAQYNVRVIIEIPVLAHTNSWRYEGADKRACIDTVADGPVPGTFYAGAEKLAAATKIINDLDALVPSHEYFHLSLKPMSKAAMECAGDADGAIQQDYINKIFEVVRSLSSGRKVIMWDDAIVSGSFSVPADLVIVQSTSNRNTVQDILRKGFKIIYSNSEAMDLACGKGDPGVGMSYGCDPYRTWYAVYRETPDVVLDASAGSILGSEVLVWGQQANSKNIEALLWPRASALGGATWEARDKPCPYVPSEPADMAWHFSALDNIRYLHQSLKALWDVPYDTMQEESCAYGMHRETCDSSLGLAMEVVPDPADDTSTTEGATTTTTAPPASGAPAALTATFAAVLLTSMLH